MQSVVVECVFMYFMMVLLLVVWLNKEHIHRWWLASEITFLWWFLVCVNRLHLRLYSVLINRIYKEEAKLKGS